MSVESDPDLFTVERLKEEGWIADVLFLDAEGKNVYERYGHIIALNVRTGEGERWATNEEGECYLNEEKTEVATERFTVPAPCKVYRDVRHVCRQQAERRRTFLDRVKSWFVREDI